LQRDGQQAGRDLLARCDNHVIFFRVMQRCRFTAEIDEPVSLASHRGNDDSDLVSGIDFPLHARSDVADALGPRHRRAAEFHHDLGHGAPCSGLQIAPQGKAPSC
jgi:hypothetical protein